MSSHLVFTTAEECNLTLSGHLSVEKEGNESKKDVNSYDASYPFSRKGLALKPLISVSLRKKNSEGCE